MADIYVLFQRVALIADTVFARKMFLTNIVWKDFSLN